MYFVYLPLVIPFNKDLSIDYESLASLARFAEEGGIRRFIAAGTTGEFSSLTFSERVKVVETVYGALNKSDSVVIGGISSTSYVESIELCREYRKIGVGDMLLLPPYYHISRGEYAGLLRFFEEIASRCDGGIYVYNNPATTGINLSVDFLEKLVDNVPSIRGD